MFFLAQAAEAHRILPTVDLVNLRDGFTWKGETVDCLIPQYSRTWHKECVFCSLQNFWGFLTIKLRPTRRNTLGRTSLGLSDWNHWIGTRNGGPNGANPLQGRATAQRAVCLVFFAGKIRRTLQGLSCIVGVPRALITYQTVPKVVCCLLRPFSKITRT